MRKLLIAFLLGLILLTGPAPWAQADTWLTNWLGGEKRAEQVMGRWEPELNDYLVIDVANNEGYLIREDNRNYYKFQLITGQKRRVCYIGLCYFAATPEREWEAGRIDIKGDRVTYGETGRFLRLFDDGRRTHYGIHGHKYADVMFAEGSRYRSMGCVIVKENFLNLIEQTYKNNGGRLKVVTTESQAEQFPFLNA